jgi:hypothetical protein
VPLGSGSGTDEEGGPAEGPSPATSRCVDWFHEGETKVVEANGVRVIVRFIGRKGRRGRIAIEAPAGAVFTEKGD